MTTKTKIKASLYTIAALLLWAIVFTPIIKAQWINTHNYDYYICMINTDKMICSQTPFNYNNLLDQIHVELYPSYKVFILKQVKGTSAPDEYSCIQKMEKY